MQDSYNVRYRKIITPEVNTNITYDFEDNTLQGWTTYDEDEDGSSWSSESSNPHVGIYCVRALYNSNGVPKNWLISPKISLGGTFSFYAKRHSSSTGEQFQVYVSTTGTDISDFTAISDVIDATNSYELYEYDLSSYSGNGYVAIMHTAATDQYYLFVDDISFAYYVPGVYGEWVNKTNVTSPLDINGLEQETKYEWQVQGIYNGQRTNSSPAPPSTSDCPAA